MDGSQIKRFTPRLISGYLDNIDGHIVSLQDQLAEADRERVALAEHAAKLEYCVRLLFEQTNRDSEVLAAVADPTAVVVDVLGVSMIMYDHGQYLARVVADELRGGSFGLLDLRFQSGDVVIDVGANVGVVSIFLAKQWPSIRVLAFEPNPRSFADLQRNIKVNATPNVAVFNLAVTADGRDDVLYTSKYGHLSSSLWADVEPSAGTHDTIQSTTLDRIFVEHGIERCHFLKVDCEGCEHEILRQTNVLDRIDYLALEAHEYPTVRTQGFINQELREFCEAHFPSGRLWFQGVP